MKQKLVAFLGSEANLRIIQAEGAKLRDPFEDPRMEYRDLYRF